MLGSMPMRNSRELAMGLPSPPVVHSPPGVHGAALLPPTPLPGPLPLPSVLPDSCGGPSRSPKLSPTAVSSYGLVGPPHELWPALLKGPGSIPVSLQDTESPRARLVPIHGAVLLPEV